MSKKQFGFKDMDYLLKSIDKGWNIKNTFKPILEEIHKEHKQIQDSNRYALILRELLYAYREDIWQEDNHG